MTSSGKVCAVVRDGVIDFGMHPASADPVGPTPAPPIEPDARPTGWLEPLFSGLDLYPGDRILEVAAGVSGGSYLAYRRVAASAGSAVMINDIEPSVLRILKRRSAGLLGPGNPCFAAFDARQVPLRDGCVSLVSSNNGFSEIRGHHHQALTEALRVLKPGGKLIAVEVEYDRDSFAGLPPPVREQAAMLFHGPVAGWEKLVESVGFEIQESRVGRTARLSPSQGLLPWAAENAGTTFRVAVRILRARKPEVSRSRWRWSDDSPVQPGP